MCALKYSPGSVISSSDANGGDSKYLVTKLAPENMLCIYLPQVLDASICALSLLSYSFRSSWLLRNLTKQKNTTQGDVLFLVNHTSQMWNTLWPSLLQLDQKLRELGIGENG